MTLNWTDLGKALRESADDAHEGNAPDVHMAYHFLLANPECFIDGDQWPPDMPTEPNVELIAAYCRATALTPQPPAAPALLP